MKFRFPDNKFTKDNSVRRIGIEIEFAGVDPDIGANIIRKHAGGTIHTISPFSTEIRDTDFGLFIFEVDAAFLKEEKYKEYADKMGIDFDSLENKDSLESALRDLAITIVPCEIVMPPVPMDKIAIARDIIDSLREKKAKGTNDSFLYAFGLHINVEIVEMSPAYLLQHMQAFSLLYDWICQKSDVDMTRRISPYINPYPDEYLDLIMQDDYNPAMEVLVDDYLELVGSRNHALDMLPVFAEYSEKKVLDNAAEPELVKPRPAFHYRLGNSRVDEPGWSIFDEWNYWLQIEKLAHDQENLNTLKSDFLNRDSGIFPDKKSLWIEKIESLLS